MAAIKINRKIEIQAPPETVINTIADFHTWQDWSPWLITDPHAKVTVQADGKHYSWEGNRVGSGEMTVLNISPNQVHYALSFLKPWKSKADVAMMVEPTEHGSLVTWSMDSKLPFYLFFMKKSMETYVGEDYRRGLMMLKDYIENGHIKTHLQFLGSQNYTGCHYISIDRKCSTEEIGSYMERDFERLYSASEEIGARPASDPFSIYHKFDMVNKNVHYTAGLPMDTPPDHVPHDIQTGSLPNLKLHVIRHTGSYDFLGGAWSAQIMSLRGKEFRKNKKHAPMEFYINDPAKVSADELITDVAFPIV